MGVAETGTDAHFTQEPLGGIRIFGGGRRQGAQVFQTLGECILYAVLHHVARPFHYIEKLVPGVGTPEFELHPNSLLAGVCA